MNKGVLQSSSPVQPMMALPGNPNLWWNMNGIHSPPGIQLPPTPPPSVETGMPPSLFPQLHNPTAAPGPSSSSSSSLSCLDMNTSDPPESWSQLILGGLVVEDQRNSNLSMSHFRSLQSKNDSFAVNHLKQENSIGGYRNIYGHPNDHRQGSQSGTSASPSTWSSRTHVSSSAISSTTTIETNSIVQDCSSKDKDTRWATREQVYECKNIANGGAQKKARVQASSAQSTIKVRKEKLGDRITVLHQIVSPFGKTDTASVLLEAIGYIRFLHSQIEALSTPYMVKDSGILGNPESEGEGEEGKDLRSRGLCLVPISCTLGVGCENSIGADYWAAANSFGGGVNFL